MTTKEKPQGYYFQKDENVRIYGVKGPSDTLVELDATHRWWGHSGNCVGTIHHVGNRKLISFTLKHYHIKRLKEQGTPNED